MGTCVVNGRRYDIPNGASVSISNGVVKVNGKELDDEARGGQPCEVHIQGDIGELRCDGDAHIDGNVTGDVDAGGSVECHNVGKSVDAGGIISCANVSGDVDAGGSVNASGIHGDVDAGGSVNCGMRG